MSRKRKLSESQSEKRAPEKPTPASRFVPSLYTPSREGEEQLGGIKNWLIPLALLFVAAILRFVALGSKGLWFDEIRTLTDTKFPRPWGYAHHLFFTLDLFFQKFSSDPTIAPRIYPALAGTLTIPILYFFVTRLHSRLAGLFSAAILCFHPFHLLYSQEARFYAPMEFFAVAALWGTVEFASEPRLRRFGWLAVALVSDFLATRNHPSSLPFVLAHVAGLFGAVIFTNWGMDALLQIVPPLRGKSWARRAVTALAVGGGLLAFAIAPRIRDQAIQVLFENRWGQTENVAFSWNFFAGHVATFGWNMERVPYLSPLSVWLSLILMIVGIALLLRRRTYFGAWLVGLIAATMIAIFAFKSDQVYQTKYTAYLQPLILTFIGISISWLLHRAVARLARSMPLVAKFAIADLLLLVIAGMLPAASHYYRDDKMPLRPQFWWAANGIGDPTEVLVYGHAAYPASLYKGSLARHRLRYLPYVGGSGLLEAEIIAGSAASSGSAAFAQCWPWDMPPGLTRFLKEDAIEAARFPSVIEPALDGILYEIFPTKNSVHRNPTRPAWAVDGLGNLGRPEISTDQNGKPSTLRFIGASAVLYNIPFGEAMKTGSSSRETSNWIEIEVTAEADGDYYFVVESDSGHPALSKDQPRDHPLILGGHLKKGGPMQWRGKLNLPFRADDFRLRLSYVSDYDDAATGRAVSVRTISVTPVSEAEDQKTGKVSVGCFEAKAHGRANPADHSQNWILQSEGALEWRDGKRDYGTLVVHDPLPADALSPPFPVPEGSLIHVRTEAQLHEAYGLAATVQVLFLDPAGYPLAQTSLSAGGMSCNVDWDPWTSSLIENPWNEFQTVIAAPPRTASARVVMLVWQSTGARRVESAANEILWKPIEVSVLAPVPNQVAK